MIFHILFIYYFIYFFRGLGFCFHASLIVSIVLQKRIVKVSGLASLRRIRNL